MRASQGEAGPSWAPHLSLRPTNVLIIFLARFHTRRGNQIEYQYPPAPTKRNGKGVLVDIDEEEGTTDGSQSVDLSGVEWKVLPSGGHLIEKDVIYFQTTQKGTTGVASFRNIKLYDQEDGDAARQQRGARMVSVGLVLQCEGHVDQLSSSLAQQLAIIPHLHNLEKLADELAHDPEDIKPLKAYYEAHKARSNEVGSSMGSKRMKQLRMRRRRDPRNLPHDPVSHMPALCGALGPLLPHLLKKLMLPRHRLLIFTPSPPLVYAANLGYNLADLAALAIARSGKRHENLQQFARRGTVHIKGQIGVHDIPSLEKEEDKLGSSTQKHACLVEQGWIAWSTDKILLEKPHLFDSVLDLTPLITRDSHGVLDEACLENASTMARLLTVVRPSEVDAKVRGRKAHLKAQSWTTRDFATFNELDVQAQRHAERAERLGPAACVSRRKSKSRHGKSDSRRSEDQQADRPQREVEYTHEQTDAVAQWRGACARAPRRSGTGKLSAILAFLRYWLAGWWFLPSHWRYDLPAAYVLPLGIRGDGGVRASILVMPEDESDEDDEDLDGEEDRDIAAEDEAEEERRSTLVAEPDVTLVSVNAPDAKDVTAGAVPIEDQHTGTNSSSDTERLDMLHAHPHAHHHHHHHRALPDPLLAAVGASPVRGPGVAESDRLSMSHDSMRRRSTDRSLYARSSGGSDMDDATLLDDNGHQHFRSILSDSLWMVWSHWTTALISGLLDILEDRLAQIEQDYVQSLSEEGDVSQLLFSKVADGLVVELGQADMASLGLSAGNKLDVELVETIGSQYLLLLTSFICDVSDKEREPKVVVNKGWSMFRWLL
ncbi:uncharacterized protein UBRO_08369 [Ustilago bromivora]|uniref:Uncharacterized protein n=1 Tax=Ustilago bromivora TaxID=307758 RepID=A0A1K0H5G1_9BASI|nr:uncharacterized protein UBRO_08369 [Ustilago bromivora]SYW75854.1 uncharacterized protein UBRO2_01009 [Ustilago bromivora]